MKRLVFTVIALCVFASLDREASADERDRGEVNRQHPYLHKREVAKPHAAPWSYTGKTSPSHWGDLSPEYVLAKTGKEQSPIDIGGTRPTKLPELEIRYRPSKIHLVYNGHTIKEKEDPGSFTLANDNRYELQQFHFHSPSEHTVAGRNYPMELHLVHRSEKGRIAVIGVFIEEGKHNGAFDGVSDLIPDASRPKTESDRTIDASQLLPADQSYFTYEGSLTTPPCLEDVRWVVLRTPIEMSKRQIERFRTMIGSNNRPTQALNGRQVFRSAK